MGVKLGVINVGTGRRIAKIGICPTVEIESIGLETPEMKSALEKLRKEGNAGMCMLGHSIFTDLSVKKTKEILGDDIFITECHSVGSLPRIVRKS